LHHRYLPPHTSFLSAPSKKDSDRGSAAATNLEVRRRVLKKLSKMSKEQRIQSLVDAGILTPKRRVATVYRNEPVLSYREPLAKAK